MNYFHFHPVEVHKVENLFKLFTAEVFLLFFLVLESGGPNEQPADKNVRISVLFVQKVLYSLSPVVELSFILNVIFCVLFFQIFVEGLDD